MSSMPGGSPLLRVVAALAAAPLAAQQPAGAWDSVARALGRSGPAGGETYRATFPRTDLQVSVSGVRIAPTLTETCRSVRGNVARYVSPPAGPLRPSARATESHAPAGCCATRGAAASAATTRSSRDPPGIELITPHTPLPGGELLDGTAGAAQDRKSVV